MEGRGREAHMVLSSPTAPLGEVCVSALESERKV